MGRLDRRINPLALEEAQLDLADRRQIFHVFREIVQSSSAQHFAVSDTPLLVSYVRRR